MKKGFFIFFTSNIMMLCFLFMEYKVLKSYDPINKRSNLPAPATTIFCFGKSTIGFPCALTAPKRPANATPAVPWRKPNTC